MLHHRLLIVLLCGLGLGVVDAQHAVARERLHQRRCARTTQGRETPPHPQKPDNTPERLLQDYFQALGDCNIPGGEYHFYDDQRSRVPGEAIAIVRRAVEQFPTHPTTDLMIRHIKLLCDDNSARFHRKKDRGVELLSRSKAREDQQELVVKTYKVADLVTPRPTKVIEPESTDTALKADFPTLVDLITSTVQPETWDTATGAGSIKSVEADLTLIVRQTNSVHEEIAGLFEKLREMGKIELGLEAWIVKAPEESIKPRLQKTAVRFNSEYPPPTARKKQKKQDGHLVLLPPQARQLVEDMQHDPRVQIAKLVQLSFLNGDMAEIRSPEGMDLPKVSMIVQAVTASDYRTIRVVVRLTDHRMTTIEVPDKPLECIGISDGLTLIIDDTPMPHPPATEANGESLAGSLSSPQYGDSTQKQPVRMRTLVLLSVRITRPEG